MKETEVEFTYGFQVKGWRKAYKYRQGEAREELGKEKDNSLPGLPGDTIIPDCWVTRQNKQDGI